MSVELKSNVVNFSHAHTAKFGNVSAPQSLRFSGVDTVKFASTVKFGNNSEEPKPEKPAKVPYSFGGAGFPNPLKNFWASAILAALGAIGIPFTMGISAGVGPLLWLLSAFGVGRGGAAETTPETSEGAAPAGAAPDGTKPADGKAAPRAKDAKKTDVPAEVQTEAEYKAQLFEFKKALQASNILSETDRAAIIKALELPSVDVVQQFKDAVGADGLNTRTVLRAIDKLRASVGLTPAARSKQLVTAAEKLNAVIDILQEPLAALQEYELFTLAHEVVGAGSEADHSGTAQFKNAVLKDLNAAYAAGSKLSNLREKVKGGKTPIADASSPTNAMITLAAKVLSEAADAALKTANELSAEDAAERFSDAEAKNKKYHVFSEKQDSTDAPKGYKAESATADAATGKKS